MNIRIFKNEEDAFSKNANGFGKIYHELLLLMKFLQTKPQIKNMNLNYHDLYYTVIKNRDDKEIVKNKNKNDYFNFNDIIFNYYIGRKIIKEILR